MSRMALVTGATGFVGSHLVELLLRRGWRVRCTLRRTSNLRWLEAKEIERAEGDLRRDGWLGRACEGVDTVFHVAGVLSAPDYRAYREGNWLATRNVMEAAVRAGVRRFLHVSTLAVAGPSADGAPVGEEREPRPISLYGKTKWEGEREARSHGGAIEVTVVRPPVVYGPRDRGLLPMFQLLSRGIEISIGGHKRISIVHGRDLVEGILAAASHPRAAGQAYYICDARPRTQAETAAAALQALGRRRRARISVTDGFVLAAGSLADHLPLGGLFGRDKAREMIQKHWVCTPEKARRELGYETRLSLEEGMGETMEWYRSQGMIRNR